MWNSTNPALANDDLFNQYYGKGGLHQSAKADVATVQGVVNKTAILATIAIAAGVVGYWLMSSQQVGRGALIASNIIALVVVFGVYMVIHRKPQASVYLAPVYAVVEGVLLGLFTAMAEMMLAARGIQVPGGVALQAFIITGSCLAAMLILYSMRILRATENFKRVIMTATLAIFITYLLSFVLSIFGMNMPFITMFSAANSTGTAAWIGLGLNVVILGIAALTLIIDFDMIEKRLANDEPKYMEWYCGFALLVTLAWIYFESVKLVVRVASMMNKR